MFEIVLCLSSTGTFMNMELKKKLHISTFSRFKKMDTAHLLPLVLAVQQIFHRPNVVLLHYCSLNV